VCRRLPQLRAEGWQVELDDTFRYRPAEVGEWTADVQESGNDWFDLSLGVEVDGKRRNVLPILLTAIRARPDLLTGDTAPQTKARSRNEDSIIIVSRTGA
jgi:non-specific serine/threonine protein kinase